MPCEVVRRCRVTLLIAALVSRYHEVDAIGSASHFAPRPWLRRPPRRRSLDEADCHRIAVSRIDPFVEQISAYPRSDGDLSYAADLRDLFKDASSLRSFCCQHEYSPEMRMCFASFEEHAYCCYRELQRRLQVGAPTPWIRKAARLELAGWIADGHIHRTRLDQFSCDFGKVFCRVRVSNGFVRECDVSQIPSLSCEHGEDRHQYETLLTAIRIVALFTNVTSECFISSHKWDDEEYPVPVWTRAKPAFAANLVRVPYYSVLSKRVEERIKLYQKKRGNALPWEDRLDKVFWRGDFTPSWTRCACDGSTAGRSESPFSPPEERRVNRTMSSANAESRHGPCHCLMDVPTRSTWHTSPRLSAVNLSLHYPEDIDARFSQIFSGGVENAVWQGILPTDSAVSQLLEIERSEEDAPLQYKYVLDMDGTTISTDRPYSLLATGAVLFKQASGTEPWLYSYTPNSAAELRPFVHFIPVAEDLSDLRAKLSWARTHNAECATIAAQAMAWADAWRPQEDAFEFVYHLLTETSKLIT